MEIKKEHLVIALLAAAVAYLLYKQYLSSPKTLPAAYTPQLPSSGTMVAGFGLVDSYDSLSGYSMGQMG